MTAADPGRVLRLSVLAWGLGHLALGRRRAAAALFVAELVAVGGVAWLTASLADTTGYAIPFAAGVAFLVAWGAQAVAAYGAARRELVAEDGVAARSSAAAIAWLSLPLLAWGTGFWLVAADAATPSAVLYRFVMAWDGGTLDDGSWPRTANVDAAGAERRLAALCSSGALGPCDPEGGALRDVRMRIAAEGSGRATAVAEAVRFERKETRLLGIFAGSELVPVSVERLLTLRLEARPAALGFERWVLADVEGQPPQPRSSVTCVQVASGETTGAGTRPHSPSGASDATAGERAPVRSPLVALGATRGPRRIASCTRHCQHP